MADPARPSIFELAAQGQSHFLTGSPGGELKLTPGTCVQTSCAIY